MADIERRIALLRGINVGGRTLKMDALKAIFWGLGFASVRTYIQSGNVVFDAQAGEPEDAILSRIETGIAAAAGFEVPTVLLTVPELEAILAGNPWAGQVMTGIERVYVTVLQKEPSGELVFALPVDGRSPDEFRVSGRWVYLLCHGGYHETAYSNSFFEKKLKVKASTRNMETMAAIAKLAAE